MSTSRPTDMPVRASRAERRLARALAGRCTGLTRLVGRGWPAVEGELLRRGVRLDDGEGPSDTVLLLRCLEHHAEAEHAELLERAWQRVAPAGRLIVCVPHADLSADEEPACARFTRASLKRLLQRIDRPHLIQNQPYRWLAMYVDARPRLDRTSLERIEVIAGLCRGRVLELGCGYGHLCDAIARRGLAIEGVDRSRLKIAHARRLFPGIPFREADILELATTDPRDTVVLAEVLEHVPPEIGDRMLARAWDLVSPGGRLIVSVPNENCVPHANHVRLFDRESLAHQLARFGRPSLVTDQPFKWLLMRVDRPPGGYSHR